MSVFEGRGEWARAMREWRPNPAYSNASNRQQLEEMAVARWDVDPSRFHGLSYMAVAMFYEYGYDWKEIAPPRELELEASLSLRFPIPPSSKEEKK